MLDHLLFFSLLFLVAERCELANEPTYVWGQLLFWFLSKPSGHKMGKSCCWSYCYKV